MTASAGYSGTPLAKKLGISQGDTVAVIDGPPHLADILAPLPLDVTIRPNARGRPDLSLVFCTSRAALKRRLAQLWTLAYPDRAVWVCWPKKSSPLYRDLTEDGVREFVLPSGLVDVKVCAVDADYSALKLVVRQELR